MANTTTNLIVGGIGLALILFPEPATTAAGVAIVSAAALGVLD